MTSLDSKLRGFLYVAIAILAFASGGVSALPISDEAKIWTGFTIGTVASGLVALRAYIDESSASVPPVTVQSESPITEPGKTTFSSSFSSP